MRKPRHSKRQAKDPDPKRTAEHMRSFEAELAEVASRREAALEPWRSRDYLAAYEVVNAFELKACREDAEGLMRTLVGRAGDWTMSGEQRQTLDQALKLMYKADTEETIAEFLRDATGHDIVALNVCLAYWRSVQSDVPGQDSYFLIAVQELLNTRQDAEKERRRVVGIHRYCAGLPKDDED